MNRKNALVVGFAFTFVVGSLSGYLVGVSSAPAPVASPVQTVVSGQRAQASIMVDDGSGGIVTIDGIDVIGGETLLDLMKRTFADKGIGLVTKDYAGMGTLVTQIGEKAGGTDGKYWQYWVNNASLSVGCDAYRAQPGDVIEWKFVKPLMQ